MRRSPLRLQVIGLVLAVLAFGCSQQPPQPTSPAPDGSLGPAPLFTAPNPSEAVPGSYIVVFKDTVPDVSSAVDQISLRPDVTVTYRYEHALKGFAANLSPSALEALRSDARVAYIEQDQIARAVAVQSNPPSWGLDRVDQRNLPRDYSYTYNQTGAGVDAYIIDTGIRLTHSDFGGRAITGVDEITSGGTASDGNGHGTHVAGTVGGASYGIAKAVRLIAVRVLDNNGSGTYTQVIAGVDWVTANHTTNPAVANMSLGGPTSTALDTAVRSAIADGIVFCVAAGNNGANASNYSPARVAEAITVAASTSTDGWASYSNYGSGVDIIAPGSSITSDWNTSDTATNTISGTSMATPHVTGAAALYLEANPGSTPAAVASGLVSNATSGVITGVPSGTVNKLLYSVLAGGPPPPPPAAPVLISPPDGATGVSVSPTLSWNASSGATSYKLQVSTDSGFGTLVVNQTGITGTSTAVSGLAASTLYYWRVLASNSGGDSPWSTVWAFTTVAGSPPAAPTLRSPNNGQTNVSRTPTLVWYASTGATSYRVQVSTSSSFTTLVVDRTVTSTSTTLSQLGSYTRYYWRVYASNAYGNSAWSSVWNFRTRR
jgi:aqualysin 1